MSLLGTRWSARARFGMLLLVTVGSLSQAQRPVATPRRSVAQGDTVQHSPFIPGGRWRPGPPAPVAEPTARSVSAAPVLALDSAGYFARPNGLLLRTGSSTYRLELRRDTAVIPLGVHTVSVSESALGGVPDWLIVETRTGTAIATYDSLHLQRATLTPVRWTARNGLSQLAVSFTTDSMFVALQGYQGRGSFAAGIPPGALVTSGMVDRLLELLPLGAGYHTGASLVSIESGAPQSLSATISVEGEEQATVGAQTVDCWLVLLRAGTLEKRYWVAKSPPHVVKVEQQTANGTLIETLADPTP